MERLKGLYNECGESELQKFMIAKRVYIEISTRIISYSKKNPINFAEFLNICFPLIEGLREALRLNTCPLLMNGDFVAHTEDLIGFMVSLEDRWNFTYTSWLSINRSSPEVKKRLNQGVSYAYEDVQTFFRASAELHDDISSVIEHAQELRMYAENIMQHARILACQHQNRGWLRRLFS